MYPVQYLFNYKTLLGSEAIASKLPTCSGTKPTIKKLLDLNLQENGGCSRATLLAEKKPPPALQEWTGFQKGWNI